METVVLPAQDHLAQERYRQNCRAMSGMIYPLGGLPRTRRKLRSPQQVFVATSLHSEVAKASSDGSVRVNESTRSGLVSPMDTSLGVLRSAPSSASNSHLPPLAILKAPQYRLNNTGFISHESTSRKQQQQQLAASISTPSFYGSRQQILRTRSDGELSQGLKKGVEGEKPFDRRKLDEKTFDILKTTADRKVVETNAEKLADRRKVSERRNVAEKKAAAGSSISQGDQINSAPKKAGVITILQRPQTKEAAAENIALFTGRPIEDVIKQVHKPAQILSQPPSPSLVEVAAVEVAPAVKDREVSLFGESATVESRSSRNVSPKKVRKKKPARDFPAKVASRASEVDSRRTREVLSDGESRRSKTEFSVKASDVALAESRKIREVSSDGESRRPKAGFSVKVVVRPGDISHLERRRSNAVELHAVPRKPSTELHAAVLVDVDDESKNIQGKAIIDVDDDSKNIQGKAADRRELVKSVKVDQLVSSWGSGDGVSIPAGLHRGSSDSLVGEIGQALSDPKHGVGISRSGSFRESSRVSTENSGAELFFLASSPQKNSERWAGPAYSNSPPPSTLPFPTFPLQRVKSSLTEVTLAEVVLRGSQDTMSELSSSPSSPRTLGSFSLFATAMQSPFVDPSSATKNLRRMLNLDVDGDFESSGAEWIASGVESATQSLKKMLQLG